MSVISVMVSATSLVDLTVSLAEGQGEWSAHGGS